MRTLFDNCKRTDLIRFPLFFCESISYLLDVKVA